MMKIIYEPFTKKFWVLMTSGKSLRSIVGKGENNGKQHVFLFPECFQFEQEKFYN